LRLEVKSVKKVKSAALHRQKLRAARGTSEMHSENDPVVRVLEALIKNDSGKIINL